MEFQHTVANIIDVCGIGVHSGEEVSMRILPASEGHGIVFKRTDLNDHNIIPAHFENVVDATLCTVIGNEYGVSVSTIEHLMSALWGCGIDNALIEVNSSEVPVLDGSSVVFAELLLKAGLLKQKALRKVLKVTKHLELIIDDKKIEILPSETFTVDFTIKFDDQFIGQQSFKFEEERHSFKEDISKARTFGFLRDMEALLKMGLGKGASLENAVGIGDKGVMNREGLRYRDEFVRHKVLDCIGDLYLAGARIQGYIRAFKSGHALNNMLLRKLFSDKEAYTFVAQEVALTA